MENVRKNRYIKLLTTKVRRNYLVSEPNYHTIFFFFFFCFSIFLAIEIRKTQLIMDKLVYLGLPIQ